MKKIILLILDGFGIREGENGNAIKMQEIKMHNNIVGITASTKHSAYWRR